MTYAETETELARVETLIQEISATARPTIRVGSVSKNWTEYLRELRAYAKDLREQLAVAPAEESLLIDFPDE